MSLETASLRSLKGIFWLTIFLVLTLLPLTNEEANPIPHISIEAITIFLEENGIVKTYRAAKRYRRVGPG